MLNFKVPTTNGEKNFELKLGTSLFFVGANGSGKTRLAVAIENEIGGNSHRISAHRALHLNPSVAKISEQSARNGLRFGHAGEGAQIMHKTGNRWGQKEAVHLLNDFDYLIQVLFAEQSNTSLISHKNSRAGNPIPAVPTTFERLVEIFEKVLPHRKLNVSGDNITTSINTIPNPYAASEMSDGERAVFYLLGQVLVAQNNCLLIFDEPELHLHRSILSRLWDELEAARPDCGFVVISHDLEFVASRGGQKYYLKEYEPTKGWIIEDVPEETGFQEDIVTLILGSRKPILFVEGENKSLDMAVYRASYPERTVIPCGSHNAVIHAVSTLKANPKLAHVNCAGIVDADDHSSEEIKNLSEKSIFVLPVSEIENIFLLADVIEAILSSEGYQQHDIHQEKDKILDELYKHATEPKNSNASILRFCQRRIDRKLKLIDLSIAHTVEELTSEFNDGVSSIDINAIANSIETAIKDAIKAKDPATLLRHYDNKGLLAIASKSKKMNVSEFKQWIARALLNNSAPLVSKAIKNHLPVID